METYDVLKDVSERTGGDIYLGVVGPVRTGKSTFIKRFMEELVLPNIADIHERERALDEMPQSGSGRTVMTAEPKFIPAEAVNIRVGDGVEMRVRLVDCVGYMVEGAQGFADENGPRMVDTPWFDHPVSFEEAAETGTAKVIDEHSTIGVVVLTDGSFGDIPAEAYEPAAQRVVEELQELGKPFVIVVNSADPEGEPAQEMADGLAERYGVTVLTLDLAALNEEDITELLNAALYEFPVREINISLPRWIQELENTHWLRQSMDAAINAAAADVQKVRNVGDMLAKLSESDNVAEASLSGMDLGKGEIGIDITAEDGLFYRVLGEFAGEDIVGPHTVLSLMRRYADGAHQWEKLADAMEEVADSGYGVVAPQLDELCLEEPQLIKEGRHFGVKLKASAPSYHIIRADVSTEITPLIGSEKQCQELVEYITDKFEDDPRQIWETNVFGKSLHELVSDGIGGKLYDMPEGARQKLAYTLRRIVNENGGGIICIIL
ncbi:MAG: stage IV sporulation protein A [Firmicutes bacterium]|nr:stage IV sporulation protein A [Bacillota bacterium]